MSKLIPETELRAIETVIRGQPEPLSAREIASRLTLAPSHRTLQFRLKRLVEKGRLVKHGARSHTKYSLPPQVPGPVSAEMTIPLSQQSSRLAAIIERSPHFRTPVGYDRQFLDSYRPNWDSGAYLDLGSRIKLGEVGRPKAGTYPAGTFATRILQRLLIDS
jgi:hypothetical protein